jgi:RecA-family ATPase
MSAAWTCPTCHDPPDVVGPDGYTCYRCRKTYPRVAVAVAANGHKPDENACQLANPSDLRGRQAFQPQPANILASTEPEQIEWVWQGYAPSGGLVMMCAPPKTGKSTHAYHLARAVAAGEPFAGQPTTQGSVLILALEERRQDVANRLRALGAGPNVYVHSGPLRSDAVPEIATFVLQQRVNLIIVDTLPRFWMLDNENDAAKVGAAMTHILALARDTGAAVLLLYHLRKSPGQDGADIRGSGDIFAHVDVALIMRRRERGEPNERVIVSYSRYDETPKEVVIALKETGYELLGNVAELRQQELTEKLLDALNDDARTTERIKEDADLEPAVRTLYRHYAEMFGKGLCDREGTGKKQDPFKYKMLAATTNPIVATTGKKAYGPLVRNAEQLGLEVRRV